jgi:CBS domain containing-hemolysin-like protein
MTLLIGFLFILIQGFFAGAETAYVVANPVRVAHLTKNTKRQEHALELLKRTELLLVLTLIGTNISVVLSGFFITTSFLDALGDAGTVVAIIVGTVGGLIFGEYLPKSFARISAERFVATTVDFFNPVSYILRPFARLFRLPQKRERGLERLSLSRPDMLTAIKLGEKIGSIEEKTSPRVANLFSAFDTPLADVMTPWDRVVKITAGTGRKRILEIVAQEGYTRYPVIDNKSGNIKGILGSKDLLKPRVKLYPPFFTNLGIRITELLRTMQSKHEHMAVVLDREEKPIGIVTFEDLLEEFVGEIRSEE